MRYPPIELELGQPRISISNMSSTSYTYPGPSSSVHARKFHSLARPPGGDGAAHFRAFPVSLSLDLSDNHLTLAKLGELLRHLPIGNIQRLTLAKNDLDAAVLG